jgi:acetolactate decarboxylase
MNIFYAVKLEGTFKMVKTRSVPRQSKPYKPLIEVAKKQPVFTFENVKGVMVGFRCPIFVKGINVPGYHLHFLTDDRKGGGHVLDFKTDDIELKICRVLNFRMLLPDNEAFFKTNLSIDREKELKKVESDKK